MPIFLVDFKHHLIVFSFTKILIFLHNFCQCKTARRKISEATRRIRCWFNKEFKAEEPLPKEFESFFKPTDHDRIKDLWSKFL